VLTEETTAMSDDDRRRRPSGSSAGDMGIGSGAEGEVYATQGYNDTFIGNMLDSGRP
jgi:hypothetical protein